MFPNILIQFFILILTVLSINANFVKQVGENEFEIDLQEKGTNFTQRVRLDKENGFVITEVPAHNGRIEATFYNDETNGLTLEISKSQKTAMISKSFMGEPVDYQKSILGSVTQDDSSDRLIVEEFGPAIALIDITGPAIDPKCIPEKYRKLIPEGYTVHLVHQVQKFINNNVFLSKDEGEFTIYDPLTQRNYTEGDDVDEVFSHVFDDILPPVEGSYCPQSFLKRSSRSKRQTATTTCRDEHGRRIEGRCGRVIRGKCSTCSIENVGYDCTRGITWKCYYTLICKDKINHKSCLKHVQSQGSACDPCCLIRGCEDDAIKTGTGITIMPTCKYLPGAEEEICPKEGTGCPSDFVLDRYTKEKKKENCYIDFERCTHVYESNGRTRNSGINCSPSKRSIRQKTFCCDTDTSRPHSLPPC